MLIANRGCSALVCVWVSMLLKVIRSSFHFWFNFRHSHPTEQLPKMENTARTVSSVCWTVPQESDWLFSLLQVVISTSSSVEAAHTLDFDVSREKCGQSDQYFLIFFFNNISLVCAIDRVCIVLCGGFAINFTISFPIHMGLDELTCG